MAGITYNNNQHIIWEHLDNIWISFGIIWNHLVNIWTHLVNIWTMDFTQMMTLLIVPQRHFMHGLFNVYRVIWDCIGVILTPCSLFYLTHICQTLIDKFDRCQGPKTVQKSRCDGLRAVQQLFNILPLFLLYCVLNKHHIVPFTCVHYSLSCLSYSDRLWAHFRCYARVLGLIQKPSQRGSV